MNQGAAEVVAAIQREVSDFPGTVGVAAKHLGTGEKILINAGWETDTASTIKTPILIALMREVESGAISLDDRLTVTQENAAGGSGILRDLSIGHDLTVGETATLMIVLSDNTATNMLVDLVGIERVNQALRDFGFPVTTLFRKIKFAPGNPPLAQTTPAELAGIMEALASDRILSDAGRETILAIMRRQQHRDLIPRYLPFYPFVDKDEPDYNGLQIANKTGSQSGFRADMALVEWPGTQYVLAVIIDGDPDTRFWAENAGERLIGRISRHVFNHFGGAALDPSIP